MNVINMADFKPPVVLPQALTSLRSWLVWRMVQLPGEKKPRKIPHYPTTGAARKGEQGGAEDREGLVSYDRAVAAVVMGRYSGVGLAMLPENGIVAIDFDDCIADGVIDPVVRDLCEGTYSEVSPSGRGVRAFFAGKLPDRKDLKSNLKVEFFCAAGYVTVTGNLTADCELWGWGDVVAPLPPKVREFYQSRFGGSAAAADFEAGLEVAEADGDDWFSSLVPKVGLTIEKAHALVNALDADGGYDEWLKVGQSLHHEFDGSQAALGVWKEWSRKSADKYPGDRALDAKWASFGRYRGQPLTAAYLLKHSKVARVAARYEAVAEWKAKIDAAIDEFDLREKIAPLIARDEKLADLDREGLAAKVQEAFKGFGTKLPLPAVRKLLAPPASTVPTVKTQRPCTEFGNAERMLDRFGASLRYVPELNRWHIWSGVHWRPASLVEIEFFAKETIKDLPKEADQHADAAEFFGFCAVSQQARMVKNMVTLAASDPRVMVPAVELDKHKHLLGVRNGVINILTGQLLPPDPNLLITKLCNAEYDSAAQAPMFEKCVADAFFGDALMVGFIRRALGYMLLGKPKEDVLFIAHGDGSNGKTTLFGSVLRCLGDYAKAADASTFVNDGKAGNAGGAREDLLRLRGARMVYVNEPDEGGELKEGSVKAMTGGDTITARGLYARDTVEIEPTWVIVMPTNHKPIVKGNDQGIWRRIVLVPFLRNFERESGGKPDTGFKEKVLLETPGILNFLIQGVKEYLDQGLGVPPKVKSASEGYRSQMDLLSEWIDEKCEVEDSHTETAQRLWLSWQDFARDRGTLRYIPSAVALGRRLDQKYPGAKGTGGVRIRKGIRLKRGDQMADDFFSEV